MFGHAEQDAIGASLDMIIPEKLREPHWDGYRRVMATGETQYGGRTLAVPALRADGTRSPSSSPLPSCRTRPGKYVASPPSSVTSRTAGSSNAPSSGGCTNSSGTSKLSRPTPGHPLVRGDGDYLSSPSTRGHHGLAWPEVALARRSRPGTRRGRLVLVVGRRASVPVKRAKTQASFKWRLAPAVLGIESHGGKPTAG